MMRGCPLPIDWLDYLDGDRPDLEKHLRECLTCQALIVSLRSQPIDSLQTNWAEPYIGRMEGVWTEDRPRMPAQAEFWFSSSNFELAVRSSDAQAWPTFSYQGVDRTLLLVVGDPEVNHNVQWLDVVPVLSDVERATETDVLFEAGENSLGAPWRALFAQQCKVARDQLDTRVGSLWEAGQMVLAAAFGGDLDDARWGVPLQHPGDPRAFLDPEYEEVLELLRTPWMLVSEVAAGEGEQQIGPRLVPLASPEPGRAKTATNVFTLHPVYQSRGELALAAASSAEDLKEHWELDSPEFKLVGSLRVDYDEGVLYFVVKNVELKTAKQLRLHLVAFGERHPSAPFAPAPDISVSLAKAVPIDAVESLEAEVVS